MRLTAISSGYAFPTSDFEACVHSVFRQAANLRPANGETLLTLVAAGESDLPQGMRLATPAGFSFEDLRVGARVFCQSGLLTIEAASLSIDLNNARPWVCDLPSLGSNLAQAAFKNNWELAWRALNERQAREKATIISGDLIDPVGPVMSAVARRAGECLRAMLESARRCDPVDDSILSGLIGLGPGLTPAGDDLLIGLLTGLWCLVGEAEERRLFITSLGEAVTRLSSATNDISRTYLYHAANRQVSSRLERLARALCHAESAGPLLATAEVAMQVGHTSGMDSVSGLLVGLDTWS